MNNEEQEKFCIVKDTKSGKRSRFYPFSTAKKKNHNNNKLMSKSAYQLKYNTLDVHDERHLSNQ